MKKIYTALTAAGKEGCGAVLCSIVSSSGSTPRSTGAKMLVLPDGRTVGTIGGGAVEYCAEQQARTFLREKRSALQSYCLSPNEAADIGMICGGEVQLYFQYFDPAQNNGSLCLQRILELLNGSRAAWTVTEIHTDGSWQMGVFDRENGLRCLSGRTAAEVEPLLSSRGRLQKGSPTLFVEPLCRAGTVYLFGAGHIGQELAHILALTDFRVVVWDERPQAAQRESFPDAEEVFCGPYDSAMQKIGPVTEQDYIVIMTPGHQADYIVLTQALHTPARYIGCIGSRKKAAAARERLLSDGFTPAETNRICTPIGLPIGGETPAEIAVSIAAQLIACRSGRLNAGTEGELYAAN